MAAPDEVANCRTGFGNQSAADARRLIFDVA
jgi:hypothetical protein